jgi:hypothetical protein
MLLVPLDSGITDYHRLPRPDGHTWITFNYFDIDRKANQIADILIETGEL